MPASTTNAWLLACLLGTIAAPRPLAAQEDWLVALPSCSLTASRPELALLYPRPGLPAVVEASGVLAARVRVVSALTPPPGIQQERALSGWSAHLIGGGIALGAAPLPHRHALSVIAVRPDTGASLVYRVRLQVAAYVAPGTYSFELRTPFGAETSRDGVRVLARGAQVRVANAAQLQDAAPETLPFDVRLDQQSGTLAESAPSTEEAPASSAQPRLAPGAIAVALRVGNELWVQGDCADDAGAFRSETRAAANAAGLQLRQWPSAVSGDSPLQPSAAVPWQRSAMGLSLDNRASARARELLVLLPARAGLAVSGAQLELFAASDLSLHDLSAIAGVWRVPAHMRAELTLSPELAAQPWSLEPGRVASGAPSVLRVIGAPESARVAFDYGAGRSALGGATLKASFAGPLGQPLRALVLPQEGHAQLLRRQVVVEPRRPPNCSTAAVGGRHFGLAGLLLLGAALLKRRRPRGFGNRLRPELRCEQRDRAPHSKPDFRRTRQRRTERRVRAVADSQHARGRHFRES
jgi:MYXO-CTERM domain-containing protein